MSANSIGPIISPSVFIMANASPGFVKTMITVSKYALKKPKLFPMFPRQAAARSTEPGGRNRDWRSPPSLRARGCGARFPSHHLRERTPIRHSGLPRHIGGQEPARAQTFLNFLH